MTQMSLLDYQPPRFQGSTVTEKDVPRLQSQQERVTEVMKDGRWRTYAEVAAITGDPVQSISARFRSARTEAHGSWHVPKQKVPGTKGLWRFRFEKPAGGSA